MVEARLDRTDVDLVMQARKIRPDAEFFGNTSISARNIGGKKYVTRAFADQLPTLGTAIDYIGDPFTWGIGATYRFGPES
jgi:hypothetical protein